MRLAKATGRPHVVAIADVQVQMGWAASLTKGCDLGAPEAGRAEVMRLAEATGMRNVVAIAEEQLKVRPLIPSPAGLRRP